jgi:UDP-glucose 4-epimerase
MHGVAPTIYGDGLQSRDFVFVKDLAKVGPTLLLKRPVGFFNLGTGAENSILSLANLLVKSAGSRTDLRFGPPRQGEQRQSVLNADKARLELGCRAETALVDGLDETIEWFRNKYCS